MTKKQPMTNKLPIFFLFEHGGISQICICKMTVKGWVTVYGVYEKEGNLENSEEDGGGESGLCCELVLSGLARLAQKRSTIISTLFAQR